MDRLNQLRGEAGASGDSMLDTSSPPSEAYLSANESSSKYFSLSEVDSTFDISPIKDAALHCASSSTMSSERVVDNPNKLMPNLSPIGKKTDFLDTYKIGEQIEAANILSGGVAIFDDNDNSYDGDELVIDDNAEVEDKDNADAEAVVLKNCLLEAVVSEYVSSKAVIPDNISPEAAVPDKISPEAAIPENISPNAAVTDNISTKAAGDDNVSSDAPVDLNVSPKIAVSDNILPDAAVPDTLSPHVAVPDTNSCDAAVPSNVSPDESVPAKVSLDTAVKDTISLDASCPNNVSSDISVPDKVSPDAAVPENVTPEANSVTPEPMKTTEVILQIDGIKVDATDIGNGLYLFRRQGNEELEAVQIYNNQDEPSFQFLKVRENAERKLEVYEEFEIEVPNEMPTTEKKSVNESKSGDNSPVLNEDTNSNPCDPTSSNIFETKEIDNFLGTTQNNVNNQSNKDQSHGKMESLVTMKKLNECRKSSIVGSFTPMTYHSTPNKDGIPLTKAMVDLQLHPNRYSDNVKKTIEVHTDSSKQKNLVNSRNVEIKKNQIFEMDKEKDKSFEREKTTDTCIGQGTTSSIIDKAIENKIETESDIHERVTPTEALINTVEKYNRELPNNDLCTESNSTTDKSMNLMPENKQLLVSPLKEICRKINDTRQFEKKHNVKMGEMEKHVSLKLNENISTVPISTEVHLVEKDAFMEKSHESVESDSTTLENKQVQDNRDVMVINDSVSIANLNVKEKVQEGYTHANYESETNEDKFSSTKVNIDEKTSSTIHCNSVLTEYTQNLSGTTITKETAQLLDDSISKEKESKAEKSCELDVSKSIQLENSNVSDKSDKTNLNSKIETYTKSSEKTDVKAESKVEMSTSKTFSADDAPSVTLEDLKTLSHDNETQSVINHEIKSTNNQESKPVNAQNSNRNIDNTMESTHKKVNSTDSKQNNTNHVDVPFGKWTDANRQAFLSRFKETKAPSTSSNGKQIKNSNDLNRRDILKKIDSKRQAQTSVNTAKVQDFGSMSRLSVKKDASVFSCKPATEERTLSVKMETGSIDKETPFKNLSQPDAPNTKIQLDISTVSKKEPTQRKEINNQELIDKTIEGIINRVVSVKSHDDHVHTALEQTNNLLHNKNIKNSKNELPIGLDEIEMKMNELHGIPFIERPPHELPHVSNVGLKTYTKLEIQKAPTKPSKIPNLIPFAKNQTKSAKENIIDIDSEEEVLEHEPVTGDMDVVRKDVMQYTIGDKVENLPHTHDFSKNEGIITEKDFDKFHRRNSINCENIISVNFDRKQPTNVLHPVVQKDSVLKTYSKNVQHDQRQYQKVAIQIQNKKVDLLCNEENNKNINHSQVKTAYQNVTTARRQIEPPITIIEDKPVKVIFMNEKKELNPNLLNVQGDDLSPTKQQPTNADNADVIIANNLLDSNILEIQEDKPLDETKNKVKHQRKQVLTPVETSDLELIEPDDLHIDESPKKKRKTEEGLEKGSKTLVPKKSYLLGRSTVTDDSNKPFNMVDSFEKDSAIQEAHHKNTAAAIDSLVKAAELLETQSGNIISTKIQSSESQSNTPVKRGRGRPRKYPLPDASENRKNTPSPPKKLRLPADTKTIRSKDSTDECDDDESSDGEIIKENWTMGKINENIVCPICDKLFRSENVVFKHVKHCTGPSPSRSESGNKSPERFRESQDSETRSQGSKSDMEADGDGMSLKDAPQKHTSRESRPRDLTKKIETIIIDDTPLKLKPEKRIEPKEKSGILKRNLSNLVCEICGKTFRQRSYLASHKIQHEKDEALKHDTCNNSAKSVFSCEICKKQFRKLHHLVNHRIIHNPVNTTTGKLMRKSSLEQNDSKTSKVQKIRKQSDDASAGFRCEPCDKSFRKLHHLVEHRETHDCINRQKNLSNEQLNTEKPLLPSPQCEICKKTFRKLHHLIEHKEQHYEASKEKPDSKNSRGSLSTKDIIHECSLCYMVFPNEHSLNKHTIICQRKKRQSAAKQAKQANENNTRTEEITDNKASEKSESDEKEKDKEIIILETKTSATEHSMETPLETVPKTEQEENCFDKATKLPLSKESPKPSDTLQDQRNVVKVINTIDEKEIGESIDLPNITSKVDNILDNKPVTTPKEKGKTKKTPLKDKVAPTVTKRRRSNLNLPVIVDTNPTESSDDDEVRYMLNPDYKVNETNEGKLFMKVRANKRSSLQIERPNSKDLVKRRISLQHPPKVPRLKTKPVQSKLVPTNGPTSTKQVKPVKLDPVPSTDSDDSDIKYSFPKSVVEKITKLKQREVSAKQQDKKAQRKSLAEKRKSLSNVAKHKSLGKPASASLKLKLKPSPVKIAKKRAEAEHRCDCGQLFSSAALLSRHTSVAHTPPRIRRRRCSDAAAPGTSAPASALPAVSTATVTKKPTAKARRNVPHKGVPVPEKMRKLMERKK